MKTAVRRASFSELRFQLVVSSVTCKLCQPSLEALSLFQGFGAGNLEASASVPFTQRLAVFGLWHEPSTSQLSLMSP